MQTSTLRGEWAADRAAHSPSPHLADPALVELALSEREAQVDRSRALRLMGFDPERRLRVLAVAAHPDSASCRDAVDLLVRGPLQTPVRCTVIDGIAAVLLQSPELERSLATAIRTVLKAERARHGGGFRDIVVGVGGSAAGLAAHTSWEQARLALRFAERGKLGEPVVDYDDLGAMAMIADLPRERLLRDRDVMAFDRLSEADIEALAAFCRHGSLRQAAIALHLHHSSVASRLARVEETLGCRLDDPMDRFRATLALVARRLLSAG